ncbi:uncharacterized protein LOC129248151 [Anastrepha obliqua]|uniref:uncharacterized protein LOC129248151 n=1 Tax=Anastrepha obliqua TaxID=95512 RepID=UPI0024094066|nr:uncharacterized protein LOC129248151 [Anastrepha obliqua]
MHHIDADKALAIFIQTEMSKYQYQVLRQGLKKEGHDILPPYSKILDAKKRCYPESMTITDTSASIDLQELIDHTAKRLLHSMTEDEIAEIDDESLIMYSKWGCDGASGQCEYSQKLGDKELCDSNLFMTSIVPLNLSCRINNNVVWKNERPSSTRYCRCIQFQFAKETPEKIRAEKNRVDAEIAQIQDSVVDIRNRVFKVRHEFFFTMLDGKTAQAVTETPASSSCFICLATTSQMNCLEKIKARPINPEAIKFGMSPLHARIKFMEYILHIAYNLPIIMNLRRKLDLD